MHQTTFLNQERISRLWYSTSAKGKVLGHVATKVANALMGRDKRDWSPGVDNGAYVIVTDVANIEFSAAKGDRKHYRFHSGYMGGITEYSLNTLHAQKPELVFQLAVKRMLPKTIQGRHQLKRLKVFKGGVHGHVSQKPQPLA